MWYDTDAYKRPNAKDKIQKTKTKYNRQTIKIKRTKPASNTWYDTVAGQKTEHRQIFASRSRPNKFQGAWETEKWETENAQKSNVSLKAWSAVFSSPDAVPHCMYNVQLYIIEP